MSTPTELLTGETVTNRQIRALWTAACGTGITDVNPDLMDLCNRALCTDGAEMLARQRCAEIINARAQDAHIRPAGES